MNDAQIAVYENDIKTDTTHLEVIIRKFLYNHYIRLSRLHYLAFVLVLFLIHIIISLLEIPTNVLWVNKVFLMLL